LGSGIFISLYSITPLVKTLRVVEKEETMSAKLIKEEVGPWSMNTYLVICEDTGNSAIIDPGADAEAILALAQGTEVVKILITHTHSDHIGALAQVKSATNAPVYVHPLDAEGANLDYDVPVQDGDEIEVGNVSLRAIHTPGHTPGQVCFDIGDGRILVGDTVFVGGPGHTSSHKDFKTTMRTMQEIVFQWPDETEFYPGHGPSGVIGEERPAFESFLARGWSSKLHGDVTWE
jgi:glyoxylase-like metal-dependent hydrolase (beta-lactamase superfamily II)